jgi:hypothetical protein
MVLIPAGPDTVRANLADTVDSINHYIGVDACRVAIVDDSRRDAFRDLADVFPNILIVRAPNFGEGLRSRKGGPLLAKELSALRTLVDSWRFDLLLKMDTDALVIGERPQFEVRAAFEQDRDVGMIGAFKRRGDGTDKQQAMDEKGLKLTREMSLPAGLRHPALMVTLRRLVHRAERHGYHRGDTCTGGAYFMSWRAVDAMRAAGHLDLALLRHSRLSEDTLMALLCGAAGYRLADMPPERDSLAINWRGLPMPLEALVSANKKIVHPVKTDDPATEAEVRAYFRRRRTSDAGDRGSSPGITRG